MTFYFYWLFFFGLSHSLSYYTHCFLYQDSITLNMQMRYRILTLYNLFKEKLVCLLMSCVKRKKKMYAF